MKIPNQHSLNLLVNANISKPDIKELTRELENEKVKVGQYYTFSIDFHEIIRFLFRDFDAYTLLRDGVLFSVIQAAFVKSINWVKKKRFKAEIQAGAEIGFKIKNKNVFVNFGIPNKDYKIFFKKIERKVNAHFVSSIEPKEIVSINWEKKTKSIKVIRFK